MRASQAGLLYFLAVFCAGFILGAVRVVLIVPVAGEMGSTLLELPIMLTLSWLVCAWIVQLLSVPPRARPRLWMGSLAFVLLMVAEAGVTVLLLEQSPGERCQAYKEAPKALGLAAQFIFAAIPLAQSSRTRQV